MEGVFCVHVLFSTWLGAVSTAHAVRAVFKPRETMPQRLGAISPTSTLFLSTKHAVLLLLS